MGTQNALFLIPDLEEQEKKVCLSVVVPTYNESENIRNLIRIGISSDTLVLFSVQYDLYDHVSDTLIF